MPPLSTKIINREIPASGLPTVNEVVLTSRLLVWRNHEESKFTEGQIVGILQEAASRPRDSLDCRGIRASFDRCAAQKALSERLERRSVRPISQRTALYIRRH